MVRESGQQLEPRFQEPNIAQYFYFPNILFAMQANLQLFESAHGYANSITMPKMAQSYKEIGMEKLG